MRLLRIASLLFRDTCLILAALLLFLTLRSFMTADTLAHGRQEPAFDGDFILTLTRGTLLLDRHHPSALFDPDPDLHWQFSGSPPFSPDPTLSRVVLVRLTSNIHFAGITYLYIPPFDSGGPLGFSIPGRSSLTLPLAYPLLLLLLPFLVHVCRELKSRRRRAVNRCRMCNYDLRASPTRCPECGAPVTTT